MLWFIHHSLWELAYTPKVDRAFHNAWDEGYAAVNAGFAAAVLEELERTPDAAVFFHDYHLYLAPRLVRDQRPDATLMHFVHVPWPQPDVWHVLPKRMRVAIHDGLVANDVIGFHTDRWRRNFHLQRARAARRRRRAADRHGADLRRSGGVRRARRERGGAGGGAGDRRDAAGEARRARRPDRSVEEHRARLPCVRALPRPASGDAWACRDARAARSVAREHSGVRRVPRRDPARGASRQRSLPAEHAGRRSTSTSTTTSRSPSPRTSSSTCCS